MTADLDHDLDHDLAELVEAATRLVVAHAKGDDHTVACAARDRDGRIITGLNVYHFTGGPCAELVAIGAAAAVGAYDLTAVVAVGNDGRGVLPPCGRCRQVLLDYFPRIEVVVGTEGGLRAVPVRELLPYAYERVPDAAHPTDPTDPA
ncbi:cytidine deaminase family protein [Streptomyces sp. NPDC059943]|uniref:cytidine deaminase family protein n=1 Tax=Streptomyces sp. NPDC059943 TaxID=3347010 RepID=UPI00364D835D